MQFQKESVFISAIRAFAKVLCGFIGLIVGSILLFIVIGSFSGQYLVPKVSLHVAPNGEGKTVVMSDSSDLILKLNIEGVIGSKKLNFANLQKTLSYVQSAPSLRDRLKGVYVYMNSPGGGATDSEEMYALLKEFKEELKIPAYTYVNGLCASGGMMIACATDKILSNNSSIIGSVGVRLGPLFNYSGAMEKLGVDQRTFVEGKDKDSMNPFRPWEKGEGKDIEELMNQGYKDFISLVSKARPKLTPEKLRDTYGAQIYPSNLALEYGYIDGDNYHYGSAMRALAKEAKCEEGSYQVLEVHVTPSLLTDLVEQKSDFLSSLFKGKFMSEIEMTHSLSDRFLYLYQP